MLQETFTGKVAPAVQRPSDCEAELTTVTVTDAVRNAPPLVVPEWEGQRRGSLRPTDASSFASPATVKYRLVLWMQGRMGHLWQ